MATMSQPVKTFKYFAKEGWRGKKKGFKFMNVFSGSSHEKVLVFQLLHQGRGAWKKLLANEEKRWLSQRERVNLALLFNFYKCLQITSINMLDRWLSKRADLALFLSFYKYLQGF